MSCSLKLELRKYQMEIVKSILCNGNTLVVLPTGLGKTLIAFAVGIKRGSMIFLSPTKPLAKQHYQNFFNLTNCPEGEVALITGEVKKKDRLSLYSKPFVFATPQTVEKDLNEVNLWHAVAVFDEAHRAVGKYAYVKIAQSLPKETLIVGLTASPGGDVDRIDEVLKNLKIKNVEIRTEGDPDVMEYVKKKKVKWITTSLPPRMMVIRAKLTRVLDREKEKLESYGFKIIESKKYLAELAKELEGVNGNLKYSLFTSYGIIVNLVHALELLETQGLKALKDYWEGLKVKAREGGRVARILVSLLKEIGFEEELKKAEEEGVEHPKVEKLIQLLEDKRKGGEKGIVFVQYVDQIDYLLSILKEKEIPVDKFVGKRKGYNSKRQKEVLEKLKRGEVLFLLSSSIGEEGIDIPSLDFVIFYEPVPSEIRAIQRRGRAGRLKEGEVYILFTKGTRDEAFLWASRSKEKKMIRYLRRLQGRKKGCPEEKSRESLKKLQEDSKVEETGSSVVDVEVESKGKSKQSHITDWL